MSTARKEDSDPSALAPFLDLLTRGFHPLAIYPRGAKLPGKDEPATGKEPIGKAWGAERWTPERARVAYRSHPTAGLGICLGPGRGPGGTWLIDLEGDGPEAEASRLLLFGGELVETVGWRSTRGQHQVFAANVDRLAAIMPGLAHLDLKIPGQPGVFKSIELPGLEMRLGGLKPDRTAKQVQSVVPPTQGTDGTPRAWTGAPTVAAAPEAFYEVLGKLADKPDPKAKASAKGPLFIATAKPPPSAESRAIAYVKSCQGAISGEHGHNQTFKVCIAVGPGFNLTEDQTFRIISEHWNPLCDPQWSEAELRRKVSEAFKAEPIRGKKLKDERAKAGSTSSRPTSDASQEFPRAFDPDGADDEPGEPAQDNQRGGFNATDTGNALRLVRDHGKKLRFCVDWGKWLRWDGRRWKEDKIGSIYRLARKTVKKIGAEAAAKADPDERRALLKWAIASESRKNLDAMIHLARFVEGIPVEAAELDKDQWLLNVHNGTIDLRTGDLLFHRREDLITRMIEVEYDPGATCPRWDQFEREIMDNDPEMVGYLRRIAGYGITGDVREHQLCFFHGEGRNGKSLWLGIVHKLLGDYATIINASLITVKPHDDHPTGMADLEGKRFVSTIEVADGKRMAENIVKQMTGGDPIKARRMRQDHYTFMPTHKIILAANHKPEISETGVAIWERVKMIPFPVTFVDADRVDPAQKLLLKDKDLEAKLWTEAPGILATLVRACLEWQRDGMKEPAPVVAATAGYRAEMDRLGGFIAELCIVNPDVRCKANTLYDAYKQWARAAGEEETTKRKFGSSLERRGYKLKESNGVSWRHGIAVKEQPKTEETKKKGAPQSDEEEFYAAHPGLSGHD